MNPPIFKPFVFKTVPANSLLGYIFLAFIAMAGLSYINFLPGVVNALAGGIGFSDVEAGQVVALNGYGGAAGSIVAIFLVRRIDWRRAMLTLLALLTIIDMATVWIDDYGLMLGWRFLAGLVGGLNVGIAFSVLARLKNPDRAFGLLLFVQFSIGSLVIYLLPGLEAQLGAHAVFYIMAGFVFVSLIFLLFLPALPIDGVSTNSVSTKLAMPLPGLFGNTSLVLLAIIFYQTAASAIWAYVGLIGVGANIDEESISMYIATTGILGLLGAMLPVINGNRFGRLFWILSGVALSMIAALLLRFSQFTPFYVAAMALLFFSWPAVQSYLLAITAEIDSSGRLSTIAGVAASVGLASGPLLASNLLGEGNYAKMLYACAIIFSVTFMLLFKPVRAQDKMGAVVLSQ